jgi:hypothetical protein
MSDGNNFLPRGSPTAAANSSENGTEQDDESGSANGDRDSDEDDDDEHDGSNDGRMEDGGSENEIDDESLDEHAAMRYFRKAISKRANKVASRRIAALVIEVENYKQLRIGRRSGGKKTSKSLEVSRRS